MADNSTWYKLWEGAQAVVGMCLRAGRAGLAFRQGETFEVTEERMQFWLIWDGG